LTRFLIVLKNNLNFLGPFLTTEMAEWYSLGYFHDNMLMVKRAGDEHFYSLGDLVRLKGNVPFSDTPFSVYFFNYIF
jgi:hypothetical protein